MTELLTLTCSDGTTWVVTTTKASWLGWLIATIIIYLWFGTSKKRRVYYRKMREEDE
jgi:hypothetical protein